MALFYFQITLDVNGSKSEGQPWSSVHSRHSPDSLYTHILFIEELGQVYITIHFLLAKFFHQLHDDMMLKHVYLVADC